MNIKLSDDKINKYIDEIHKLGGTCYLVGGYVRDKIIDENNIGNDIDIEVHDIEYEKLLEVLGVAGDIQGNFGIIKIKDTTSEFAMPRVENKIGIKHQDFEINIDPFMDLKTAAIRRDFTMNSLMYNLKTGELIDNYGGKSDINNKIIRNVSDKFSEDPLRIMRAIRFSFNLGFNISEETVNLCLEMIEELHHISVNRKHEEFRKMIDGKYYKQGLEYLKRILFVYYDIDTLSDIDQNPLYHPEGNVWIHTKQSLLLLNDRRNNFTSDDYYVLFATLLFHDIGKIEASVLDENDVIRSHGHEELSYQMAKEILDDLEHNKKRKSLILKLIKDHMKPIFIMKMRSKTIIELFESYGDNIYLLLQVFLFDKSARSKNNDIDEMRLKYEELTISSFDCIVRLYEFYKESKQKYNGHYFIDKGIKKENIKNKQLEKLIKEMTKYRKKLDEENNC